MTRFFFADPDVLAVNGHAGFASLPFLFDRRQRLLEAESRYIRERAMREWPRNKRPLLDLDEGGLPKSSIDTVARRLQHFADWCEVEYRTRSDPGYLKLLKYSDVLRYQKHQMRGVGPFEGRKVSPAIATSRADVATDFLRWATARGLRGKFDVSAETNSRKVNNDRTSKSFNVTIVTRAGRDSRSRNEEWFRPVEIPERSEIARWLAGLRQRRGLAKYLVCRFMVETGVRLAEAVAIRVPQWLAMNAMAQPASRAFVRMHLVETKNGTPRTIDVPTSFARIVHQWILGERLGLTGRLVKDGDEDALSRVFISDRNRFEGSPIRRHTVYDCFKEVEPRSASWHPHLARHAYACHFVRDLMLGETNEKQDARVQHWIESKREHVKGLVRRQLGHVSNATTDIYFKYLSQSTLLLEPTEAYHCELDGEAAQAATETRAST